MPSPQDILRDQIARTTVRTPLPPFTVLHSPARPAPLVLPEEATPELRLGCAAVLVSLAAWIIVMALILGGAWMLCGWLYLFTHQR